MTYADHIDRLARGSNAVRLSYHHEDRTLTPDHSIVDALTNMIAKSFGFESYPAMHRALGEPGTQITDYMAQRSKHGNKGRG